MEALCPLSHVLLHIPLLPAALLFGAVVRGSHGFLQHPSQFPYGSEDAHLSFRGTGILDSYSDV